MTNPWLNIPASDYDGHMAEVGQSQVLSRIFLQTILGFSPNKLGLLGCATGNGLEHIDQRRVEEVHIVDINPQYLRIAVDRYKKRISKLISHQVDLSKEHPNIPPLDLIFVGLVFEYVSPEILVPKLKGWIGKHGHVVVVIQENAPGAFVSKSRFPSLGTLATSSHDIDAEDLTRIFTASGFSLVSELQEPIHQNKNFCVITYIKS